MSALAVNEVALLAEMNALNPALLQLQTDPLQTRIGLIEGDKA